MTHSFRNKDGLVGTITSKVSDPLALEYNTVAPPMTDEWVRERAGLIISGPAKAGPVRQLTEGPCGTYWTDYLHTAIAAFGQECITRTREAERALAAEALRRAMAAQEKAVAAERERLLNRFRAPNEAMVEHFLPYHLMTREDAMFICRALAATLGKEE